MEDVLIRWQAQEYPHSTKEKSWYWTIGIVAVAVAIAAIILKDYLFALIAVIGGFTVMLVGSARPPRHTYSLTENGFSIGREVIPYDKIKRFAISEDDPRHLTLETLTLIGVIKAPLAGADFRAIRTELKNRDIQEEDRLDEFVDRLAKTIGL